MNLWIAVPTFVAALVWLATVVFYWIRARWWESPEGRNTEVVSLIVALLLIRLSAIHIWPDYRDRTISGFLIYTAMAFVGVWRMALIEKAQRGIRAWSDLRNKGK